MGASRLKPLTVKEIQKLTATLPSTIKHRSLGGVPGFVLVHTPAGYTGYGLIYRAGSERKKLTLGSTKMLSLAEARKLAGQYRAKVEAGFDPHGEKLEKRRQAIEQRRIEEQRLRLDVESMYAKYMQMVGSQLRSRGEKERIFRIYILPYVQGLCVTEITKNHALEAIDALVARGRRPMADKVRQEGSAFFEWLIERDHVERNVFARIRKMKNVKSIRTRVLTDDEIRAIWIGSEPEGHWACWLKLLILTGCRNMEVRGARWSEIDFEQRLWTIPAERYKNGRPHTVYLTDPMIKLWNEIPRFKSSDLVFPALGNMSQPMSGVRLAGRFATPAVKLEDTPTRWRRQDLDDLIRKLPREALSPTAAQSPRTIRLDTSQIEAIADAVVARLAKPLGPTETKLVSVKEATTYLGIGRTSVYKLIGEKRLTTTRIGRRTLVCKDSIDAILRET